MVPAAPAGSAPAPCARPSSRARATRRWRSRRRDQRGRPALERRSARRSTTRRSATVGAWIATVFSAAALSACGSFDRPAADLQAPLAEPEPSQDRAALLAGVEPAHLLPRPEDLDRPARRARAGGSQAPAPRHPQPLHPQPPQVVALQGSQPRRAPPSERMSLGPETGGGEALPVEGDAARRRASRPSADACSSAIVLGSPPLALLEERLLGPGSRRVGPPEDPCNRLPDPVCGRAPSASSRPSAAARPRDPSASAPSSSQTVAPMSVSSRACRSPAVARARDEHRPGVVVVVPAAAAPDPRRSTSP